MEELAQVYARSLYEIASEKGEFDTVRDQLGEVADVIAELVTDAEAALARRAA